ncbi:hypothetical protein OPT61_g10 [Boeremia exigua]|uniref:Uncharacterized protein n=1 Tax=Boeremia exigua TaxID=749465 RepID=A0ACC2IV98_9PLEO|nr:hypothetical protein OPT61_g10 [Boeremia exigua]
MQIVHVVNDSEASNHGMHNLAEVFSCDGSWAGWGGAEHMLGVARCRLGVEPHVSSPFAAEAKAARSMVVLSFVNFRTEVERSAVDLPCVTMTKSPEGERNMNPGRSTCKPDQNRKVALRKHIYLYTIANQERTFEADTTGRLKHQLLALVVYLESPNPHGQPNHMDLAACSSQIEQIDWSCDTLRS